MTPAEQLADLRRQGTEFRRAGYDGHNRKPHAVSMRDLRRRRWRRRWNRILGALVRGWLT
jgi:hypothetical protein